MRWELDEFIITLKFIEWNLQSLLNAINYFNLFVIFCTKLTLLLKVTKMVLKLHINHVNLVSYHRDTITVEKSIVIVIMQAEAYIIFSAKNQSTFSLDSTIR